MTSFGLRWPTDAEWAGLANPNLIMARVALNLGRMTKPQVVDFLADLIDQRGDAFAAEQLSNLHDVEDFFGGLHDLLKMGSTRFMCAAAALVEQRGEIEDQPSAAAEASAA